MNLKSFFFISAFSLLACNSYKSKVESQPEDTVAPSSIDYAFVNDKVFQPKCFQCHSLAGGNKGGVNLESYDNVLVNLADIQIDIFTEDSMPPLSRGGPLGAYEKNVLKMWLDAGAPHDEKPALEPEPTPTPPPVNPVVIGANWNDIYKNVFEPKCIVCHQAGEKAEDFPLTDKDWVVNPANGLVKAGSPPDSSLYVAITRTDRKVMPPLKTGMTLSAEEIDAIKSWILNGAKD
ncbi:MAG TPA: cytochrome c [Pseudobdellovibrionaceae bacterium]|jgi:mono/diheme cytochrome c family protein